MPTNQATTDDLGRRSLRPLTPAELTWAATALDDAYRQILVRVPSLPARLDDPTLPADDPLRQVVVQVTCTMLLRVLANPDGVLEETIDDHTRRLDASVSTGALYLTDGEVALLADADGSPEGAFSVRAVPQQVVSDRPGIWFPGTSTDTWPRLL